MEASTLALDSQLRLKYASGLLTQLRHSSCAVTFISLAALQSESTTTLHPGLSVCMLDPKSPLAAAGIFAAGILVRTNQNCVHDLESIEADTLKAAYVKANWLT